jgi:branched-subunit amino acid ABC-type transport system permease component
VAPTERHQGDTHQSFRDIGNDVIQLVIAYVKQETIGPLRAVGRFLVFGIVGFTSIAIGAVLLLVSLLRLLQEETGAFHGNLSWIPYLIVAVIATGVIAVAAWRVSSGPAARRLPTPEEGST